LFERNPGTKFCHLNFVCHITIFRIFFSGLLIFKFQANRTVRNIFSQKFPATPYCSVYQTIKKSP
jgi:hypothetical protein